MRHNKYVMFILRVFVISHIGYEKVLMLYKYESLLTLYIYFKAIKVNLNLPQTIFTQMASTSM